MRVALVGLGDAGRHHARALAALAREGGATFAALCARDAGRIERFRGEAGVTDDVASFTSLEALLDARACDAVILATPDGVHAEQVAHAAAAGVHVLVEKPLALSRADGERALAAARAADVTVQVGYHHRFHAAHALVRERLAMLVGAPCHVFARWAWADPAAAGWRARGDGARWWALAALGTHAIDLVSWLTDRPIVGVAAILDRNDAGMDRAADVSLALGGGLLAHVAVAVTHGAVPRVHIAGDAGEIELVATLGARGAGDIVHRAGREPPRPIAFQPVDPYLAQLRAFVIRAAAGGFDDGAALHALANLEILERIAGCA